MSHASHSEEVGENAVATMRPWAKLWVNGLLLHRFLLVNLHGFWDPVRSCTYEHHTPFAHTITSVPERHCNHTLISTSNDTYQSHEISSQIIGYLQMSSVTIWYHLISYVGNFWLVVWIIFSFSIQLGIVIPIDFHIFQRGRLNHQPVIFMFIFYIHAISKQFWDHIWGFPKMEVPQNGCFMMENPIKMDDLGLPLFREILI